MSVISPARAAAMKAAEKAAGAAVAAEPVERYPVPYTLAVSTVDKLTLELDFCAEDIAGGAGLPGHDHNDSTQPSPGAQLTRQSTEPHCPPQTFSEPVAD